MRDTDAHSRSLHTLIKYRKIAPTAAYWSATCKLSHSQRILGGIVSVLGSSWPQFRPLTLRIEWQWPCATINARCCSVYQLRRVWGISKWHWVCEWRRFYGWTKAFYVGWGQVLWFLLRQLKTRSFPYRWAVAGWWWVGVSLGVGLLPMGGCAIRHVN